MLPYAAVVRGNEYELLDPPFWIWYTLDQSELVELASDPALRENAEATLCTSSPSAHTVNGAFCVAILRTEQAEVACVGM